VAARPEGAATTPSPRATREEEHGPHDPSGSQSNWRPRREWPFLERRVTPRLRGWPGCLAEASPPAGSPPLLGETPRQRVNAPVRRPTNRMPPNAVVVLPVVRADELHDPLGWHVGTAAAWQAILAAASSMPSLNVATGRSYWRTYVRSKSNAGRSTPRNACRASSGDLTVPRPTRSGCPIKLSSETSGRGRCAVIPTN
jgi:hypothetical protein